VISVLVAKLLERVIWAPGIDFFPLAHAVIKRRIAVEPSQRIRRPSAIEAKWFTISKLIHPKGAGVGGGKLDHHRTFIVLPPREARIRVEEERVSRPGRRTNSTLAPGSR
jgi:hypothetical protein